MEPMIILFSHKLGPCLFFSYSKIDINIGTLDAKVCLITFPVFAESSGFL
jgi:hypothetical protein